MAARAELPPRCVVGFRRDEHGDWMAVLACGHTRHVRHRPPWIVREWVLTEAGRRAVVGSFLGCARCAAGEPPVMPRNPG